MGRIGATLSGVERALLNRLAESNAAITLNNFRLATGHKINAPADNPTAFVELALLRSQLTSVTATLSNVTAASSLVSKAQLALDQIHENLDLIRSKALEDEDQTLTANERAENQAAIDAAIVEINRLAASDAGGRRVLDGSANFRFSGLNASQVADLRVYSTETVDEVNGTSPAISGSVDTAATRATLAHDAGGATIAANATFTLSGSRGSASISVTTADTLSDAAGRINLKSHQTGVTATVNGTTITLSSIDYGTGAIVGVEVTSGAFAVTGGNGDGTANGTNAVATINDREITADDGNRFTVNQGGYFYTIEFQGGFTGDFHTIEIGPGALEFALSPGGAPAVLAIPGVQAARLGGISGTLDQIASGGAYAGLDTNTSRALRIIDEALGDVTRIEGAVNGFSDATISSSAALMQSFQTNFQDSIDAIDKVDDNEEELLRTKNEILAANAVAGLAILAQQRMSIVDLIKQIAGLN